MSTRGKSNDFASLYDINDFVSIGETQQSAGSGADINAEGEANLTGYLPAMTSTLLAVDAVTFVHNIPATVTKMVCTRVANCKGSCTTRS